MTPNGVEFPFFLFYHCLLGKSHAYMQGASSQAQHGAKGCTPCAVINTQQCLNSFKGKIVPLQHACEVSSSSKHSKHKQYETGSAGVGHRSTHDQGKQAGILI